MISVLVTLLIVAVVVGLIWWVCDYLPVPPPMNKLVKVISMIIGVIIIIWALLGVGGVVVGPPLR